MSIKPVQQVFHPPFGHNELFHVPRKNINVDVASENNQK